MDCENSIMISIPKDRGKVVAKMQATKMEESSVEAEQAILILLLSMRKFWCIASETCNIIIVHNCCC